MKLKSIEDVENIFKNQSGMQVPKDEVDHFGNRIISGGEVFYVMICSNPTTVKISENVYSTTSTAKIVKVGRQSFTKIVDYFSEVKDHTNIPKISTDPDYFERIYVNEGGEK